MFGVPQGSVLGPIEFCIYTIPLGAIMQHYKIEYHIYTDDTQLYCSFDINSPDEALHAIHSCISDIWSWMIGKKLKINYDKTEFLIITSPKAGFSANLQLKIGKEIVLPSTSCKSYGERSFGFSAPTEWNKLPMDVKSAQTLASFKVKLKTHLYKVCYK